MGVVGVVGVVGVGMGGADAGAGVGAGCGEGGIGIGGGLGAGDVAHAARIATHATIAAHAIERMRHAPIECEAFVRRASRLATQLVLKDLSNMWILVVEAMIAVGLLLFIVWWTLGPTQRREREEMQRLAQVTLPPPNFPLEGKGANCAASLDEQAQCSDRGTASENSGIVASKRVPSSATTK